MNKSQQPKLVDTYEETLRKQRIRSKNYYWANRERCLAKQRAWRENRPDAKNRKNISENEWREIKQSRELSFYYKNRDRIRQEGRKTYKPVSSRIRRGEQIKRQIPYWLPPVEIKNVTITVCFD